jgi:hypothetical protein
MCRLYSRKGGPISLKWGEGERDGTFDREEGLADTSGSHRGVLGKMEICHTLIRVNTI